MRRCLNLLRKLRLEKDILGNMAIIICKNIYEPQIRFVDIAA